MPLFKPLLSTFPLLQIGFLLILHIYIIILLLNHFLPFLALEYALLEYTVVHHLTYNFHVFDANLTC